MQIAWSGCLVSRQPEALIFDFRNSPCGIAGCASSANFAAKMSMEGPIGAAPRALIENRKSKIENSQLAAARAIHLYNRQRTIRLDMAWLRRFAPRALAECEGEGIAPGAPLESLGEIEVSVVSDRAIAVVHRRFMDVAGATDVITFEHGEIVISAATAERQAREYGQRLEHELGLYIIHGILHLNGHDDLAEPAASRMKEAQAAVLRRVLGIMGTTW